eukprot:2081103-Rhodomonas_salina.3
MLQIAKPKNDGHVLQKPAFVINSEKIENTGRSIAMVLGATIGKSGGFPSQRRFSLSVIGAPRENLSGCRAGL